MVNALISWSWESSDGNEMAAKRVVAIHQPNFLPWLGYFNKIARADVFVALDSVQFQKTGGTWCNRVRMIVNGRATWMTMPVERSYHGVRVIREMRSKSGAWRTTLLRTVETAYGRAPYFNEVFPVVNEVISNPTPWLAEFNLAAVRALAAAAGLDAEKVVVASALEVSGRATDLLISIVHAVGGSSYLCGGGAAGYQEEEKFAAAGIELVYQDFRHPRYPQRASAEFQPGLSIVDALMNCGFDATHRLVREGSGLMSGEINDLRGTKESPVSHAEEHSE
jgi:hypothetical protein